MFSLIVGLHLGHHLGYIEMLNDARVALLGFFKDNVYTTRINKEKQFKIKFQVLLKFAQILPDYNIRAPVLLNSLNLLQKALNAGQALHFIEFPHLI